MSNNVFEKERARAWTAACVEGYKISTYNIQTGRTEQAIAIADNFLVEWDKRFVKSPKEEAENERLAKVSALARENYLLRLGNKNLKDENRILMEYVHFWENKE